jgi:hypothetical protein
VTTWAGSKKLSALPFTALHHPPWDYGIVFALRRDTAVAPGGGRSFYSCIYPNGWPIEGGDYSDVYTWLDPQRTRYGFGYGSPWSSAGLVHALGAIVSLLPALDRFLHGGRSGRHHRLLKWGLPSSSNIRSFWAEPDINYLYMNKRSAWVLGGPR